MALIGVKFVFRLGCLVLLLATLLAVLLYPRATWLFGFVAVGIAIVILSLLAKKDLTPEALADQIERLLDGIAGAWDVDDFEHASISNPQLRDYWRKTFEIGGLPEEWVRLDEGKKNQLREIVRSLRKPGGST